MLTFLLNPALSPFTIALALLFGLLLLELLAAFMGASFLGNDTDADLAFDVDADADFDFDVDLDADFDADFDFDAELEAAEALDSMDATAGLAGWLGIGKVPLMIWVAAFLFGYGTLGVALQSVLDTVLSAPLTTWMAGLAVVPLGLGFAGRFARLFARILPKSETTAVSKNHLGRRRGVVSQGTAARGKPAEVRVFDGHGNTHYLRAEPLRDGEEIAQGTEVLVIRKPHNKGYRLIAVDA